MAAGGAIVSSVVDSPSSLPLFTQSPSFPLEGHLRVKRLDSVVASEPAREGEDPSNCVACSASDDAYIWVSERWRVRATDAPTGLPMVLILESRSHLDLGDLPNLLAAELGVMTVRLERAIRSLDEVASVHVNRWGDGAAHLHLWFLARPVGQLQLRGPFLAMWDEILDPVPDAQWRSNLAHIAAWLEGFGGRAQVAPPRIDWHAPSTFAGITAIEDPSTDITIANAMIDGDGEPAATSPVDAAPTNAGSSSGAGRPSAASSAGDWTTIDYDGASDNADADTESVGPRRTRTTELASDDSETMSVQLRSDSRRPSAPRSRGRTNVTATEASDGSAAAKADDTDFDLASDPR